MPDYQALMENWKGIAKGWERLAHEREREAQKATALLIAVGVTQPQPVLQEYAQLIRQLLIAADAVYVTPKVSQNEPEDIKRIMNAVRALQDKTRADGLAFPRE